MQRVVQRAEAEDKTDLAAEYSYEKRSVTEELDSAGKVTRTNEETYIVFPIRGVAYSRLVKIQNRSLTEKEIGEQDRKEEEFRKSLTKLDAKELAKTNQGWLDKSLVDRFAYQVESRDTIDHRPALMLSFSPKPGSQDKTVEDRVLNRLAGTLWVDEQDWEISRLKVGLTADLSLGWFGMVGSIKQLDIQFQQTRLPEGVWVPQKQTFVLRGRKVFSSMRYRTVEESSKFRKP
jgi:hypothetical protein